MSQILPCLDSSILNRRYNTSYWCSNSSFLPVLLFCNSNSSTNSNLLPWQVTSSSNSSCYRNLKDHKQMTKLRFPYHLLLSTRCFKLSRRSSSHNSWQTQILNRGKTQPAIETRRRWPIYSMILIKFQDNSRLHCSRCSTVTTQSTSNVSPQTLITPSTATNNLGRNPFKVEKAWGARPLEWMRI